MQAVVHNKNTLGSSLLAALALAFASLGDAFLYAYLPANFHSIGLSAFWVGLVLSVNRFTRLFLNSWVAFYLGRHGIKTVTIIATILAVVTTISYGFVVSGILWIIVRITWGITFSTLRLTSLMYGMQHHKKGISLGLNKSIIALGPVLSLFIAPVLLSYFDRSIVFTFLGTLTAIGIIMAMLLPKLPTEKVERKDLNLSFPSSLNQMVVLNSFIVEGVMVILLSKLILNDQVLSTETILFMVSFCLAYRRICLVVFSPIAGWLADQYSFEKIFNFTNILLTMGVALIAFGLTIPGIIMAFTFAAMNASVSPGSATTKDGLLLKEISDNATWRDIGAACGTIVGGLLLNFPYFHIVFTIATGLLVLGLTMHFNRIKKQTVYNGIS